MSDRAQLHHLADRARRGVLLPAEGALLADAVAEMEARIVTLEAANERVRVIAGRWAQYGSNELRTAARVLHTEALDEQPDLTIKSDGL